MTNRFPSKPRRTTPEPPTASAPPPRPEILVVEDEPEIAELIEFHLEREGFPTRVVRSGRSALDMIRKHPPDLVVLDVMLPDVDGFEICRRLRSDSATDSIPVIMVTARSEDADVVTGIELGADDYVVKPFSPAVLVARIRNVLRRHQPEEQATSTSSGQIRLASSRLVIDIDRHQVSVDDRTLNLTRTEFSLLRFLCVSPGVVRRRDQIITAVHGRQTVLSSRTVDVHVTAIRKKLGDLGSCIETVRGIGYRFVDPIDSMS